MTTLRATMQAHQRLCVLRHLAAAPSYRANDSLLDGVLDQFGLSAGRDSLRALLVWLEEQGLVTLAAPSPSGAVVATLTDQGLSVAQGREVYPGVQRPSPGATAQDMLRSAAGLPSRPE